jgi:oligopeptide/dipeptide ABC transporter ATP-binding protein
MLKFRREIQIIYQDPYKSLSPRLNIYDLISEPLKFFKITATKTEIKEKVKEILEVTGLPLENEFMFKHPLQLSGGQRQRVEIARRLILNPKFLVADEPVSMLDASVKGSILNLLADLKKKFNLTVLLITHDLSIAWHLCDRIEVMYLGKIVEIGSTEDVVREPLHPYTKALMSVVPTLDPQTKAYIDIEKKISGMVSSAANVPSGCRFHPRCNYKTARCVDVEPEPVNVGKDHKVICHLYN